MNTYILLTTLTLHMHGLCPFCLGKFKRLGKFWEPKTRFMKIQLVGKTKREYLQGWVTRTPESYYWKRLFIQHSYDCRRKDRGEL